MSTTWIPPRRTYHLRVFAISLVLVLLCLVGFLFAVCLEAVVPATGIVRARHQEEMRSTVEGTVELGWYEGVLADPAGAPLTVRVDGKGNGLTDHLIGGPSAIGSHKSKISGWARISLRYTAGDAA